MPKVYLDERKRLCCRLAAWVQEEKDYRGLTDADLAKDYGISPSAMSRKLRLKKFSYMDFTYFVGKFKPDTKTLLHIVGL